MHKRKAYNTEEHEEDEDGELWLVSYADMMTLLFGFFVILYSFSTLDENKFKSMADQMAEAFKNPKEKVAKADLGVNYEQREVRALQLLVAMLNLGDDMNKALRAIEKAAADTTAARANNQIAKQIISHRSDFEGASDHDDPLSRTVELILPDTSLFAQGSSKVTPAAAEKLRLLAADIRLINDLSEIEIIGHTDGTQSKAANAMSNFTLSSLRAGAIATELMRYGIAADKLSVRGMGSLKPLVPETDSRGRPIAANMAKNRRVHLMIRRQDHGKTTGH